ncbi:MAG: DUF2834 domain-containing protein [Cyanobacteria bacterium P01_A01_bin.45]
MLKRVGFWLLWIAFATYGFLLSPPDSPDTFDLIKNLSTGNWNGINPLIIALFNIMGILPIMYSCFVFADGREQKIPAWIFASASFGVGAFALLPYLGLREPNPKFTGNKNIFLKILDSRITGILLTIAAVTLVVYGFTSGNWSDFIQQWQTKRFIHVMSLDFCLLSLLFPALLGDDMARRGLNQNWIFWLVSFIPLFGALIYLSLRPPITTTEESSVSAQTNTMMVDG